MELMNSVAESAGTGCPAYTETLPCEPASARRARRLVHAALAVWGLEALNDAAGLVVTELVANSAQHTAGHDLRAAVTRLSPNRVRIAVIDKSTAQPVVRVPTETDEHGRGLGIVTALSSATGTERIGSGKQVWADIAAPEEGQR